MDDVPSPRTYLPVVIVSILLFAGVLWSYQSTKNRSPHIVLPGGITYLGPSPSSTPASRPSIPDARIPIPDNTKWIERKGVIFPYSFTYPDALSLGVFPSDPYDSITVFYDGTDANKNIFFRVEDLNKLNKKEFIGKPMEYAQTWWKDYAWKGVSNVTKFTNVKGLKGYRAKYIDNTDQTPYDHVFFEVPGRSDLIIWVNGKLFVPEIFDRIVDSVSWRI